MSVSTLFIHRPVGTALLTAAVALSGIISFRLLPVAPLPPGGLPDHLGMGGTPRRQPGNHGVVRRNAARKAVHTDRRRDGDDLLPVPWDSSNITLQFDLNRDIDGAEPRRAGGHQCGAVEPAGESAEQSLLA